MVYIKIEKFEKDLGRIEKAHIHCAGDRIGWWAEMSGTDPISKHRVVLAGGKTAEVDLNTEMRLIAVEPKRIVLEVRGCKPAFAQDGSQKGCELVLDRRAFETHEIVYEEGGEEKKILVPDPALSALAKDRFCAIHTPNGPTVSEPKDLTEGRKLLDEADRLWEKDSESAIKLYKRLLAEYGEAITALKARTKVERRAQQ